MKELLGFDLVAAISLIYWATEYPEVTWKAITFQYNDVEYGRQVSLVHWLFIVAVFHGIYFFIRNYS